MQQHCNVCVIILCLWWIYQVIVYIHVKSFSNCFFKNFKLFLISSDCDTAVRAGYPVIAELTVESPANPVHSEGTELCASDLEAKMVNCSVCKPLT